MTNAELATQIYPRCAHNRAMLLQVLNGIDKLPGTMKLVIFQHVIRDLPGEMHWFGVEPKPKQHALDIGVYENYRAAVSVQRVEDMHNLPRATVTTGFGICANVFEGVGVQITNSKTTLQ